MKFDSRMQKALAVLASIHAAGSSADAAKAAGVSLDTLLKWFSHPEFRDRLRLMTEQESDSARAEVWHALLEKCRAGDSSAIRLYFDLKDRKSDPLPSTHQVIIIDDISKNPSH